MTEPADAVTSAVPVPSRLAGLLLPFASRAVSPPRTTRTAALDRMERTCAVTHLVASLEHLANSAERRPGGVNDWAIARDSSPVRSRVGRRLLDVVADPRVTAALHVARTGCAVSLLLPARREDRHLRLASDAFLSATSLVLHPRHHYGTDGSDQVSFLVQTAAAVGRAAGSRSRVVDAALWTVAIQSTMSYAVSGWAKLAGTSWRSGTALEGVSRTLTYGDARAWRLVRRYPRTARAASSGVLALECSFPLAYVAGGRLAPAYAAATTAFHLSIARVMALGRFVPAFTAMHPAVLYTSRSRATTAGDPGGARDDSVLRGVGLLAGAGAAAALSFRRRTRAAVLAGRGDHRQVTTPRGARLAYRVLGPDDTRTCVYLLEHALLSTPDHWEWVAERLARDGTVVTYSRAGYGPSVARMDTPVLLEDLVADAAHLAEHVARGRRVVLVGHSLGGWLALRTAARARVDLAGVALVDTSHPHELQRSPRQAAGASALSTALPLMAASLDLGLGVLLERPAWVDALPPQAQDAALGQYRDSRLWHAGRREWAAALREFESLPALPRVPCPVLSLSASRTVEQDPVQGDLHRELADLGSRGEHRVVPRSDHDSLLTSEVVARRVSEAVLALGSTAAPVGAVGAVA